MNYAVQDGFDFTPHESDEADEADESGEADERAIAWQAAATSLDRYGNAILPALLTPAQCEALIALYADEQRFRSTIVMARHNFGRGEYRYFAYPLPPLLDELRHALYARLAPIANRWNAQPGIDPNTNAAYPRDLDTFLARCHRAGQTRPTPLILRYGSGDYNCLHQDLYGDQVFPLQVAILLSEPGRDFTGGEFVMTESASNGQRAEVVPLAQGDAVVFAVHHRAAAGKRGGIRKVAMRHGVSVVRSGHRYTVGLIFHDAR
ncbi:MAG: 2OG-Fe(II) oxygenase [Paraburkholderia tropica]|uniref:Fe2OG dioxygenase domain-containing protein n=1 Tax=Paraburkholderia tropica TaxID=92647 RepID=A0ABX5MFQ3_9BURK|nr:MULTISPECIES: 2OG-Fe(II) oxygenase [Paraburkholderia]MDE1139894.1 2OG-Fe(II) oxygenase [Paraburkholderia tropica]PXX09028.1 hypothetical protein C7400_12579 [Paraburkholderia tropica]PZW74201.1 hypothetical protein C7399_12512 [Paraburkholderia tropica]RQM45717.1 proline hydroxylase [Paraburkholderia bannensis]